MRMSLVKISVGISSEVESIQTKGKIVSRQRKITTPCAIQFAGFTLLGFAFGTWMLAIVNMPLNEAVLQPGKEHGSDEDDQRNGAGGADLEEAESLLVEVVDDVGRLVIGSAVSQHIDSAKDFIIDRDDRRHQHEEERWRDQRPANRANNLPAACTIDLRCFDVVGGYGFECGQIEEQVEAETLPGGDDDDAPDGGARIGQPVHPLAAEI